MVLVFKEAHAESSTGWCDDDHADAWVVHHNTKQLKFTP
jgi:hypothetical protein